MRLLLAVLLLGSIGCTDAKAQRCTELSRQYEAALAAPLPAGNGRTAPEVAALRTVTAQRETEIDRTRRAYEAECRR